MVLTFALVTVGWIIFRATGMPSFLSYMRTLFSIDALAGFGLIFSHWVFIPIAIMLAVEWINRQHEYGLWGMERLVRYDWMRMVLFAVSLVLVLYFRGDTVQFIYFQF